MEIMKKHYDSRLLPEIRIETDKMKPKTLKDLECLDADHPKLCEDDHTYSGKEIKQELIKRVKIYFKRLRDGDLNASEVVGDLMEFYNITEEDLK